MRTVQFDYSGTVYGDLASCSQDMTPCLISSGDNLEEADCQDRCLQKFANREMKNTTQAHGKCHIALHRGRMTLALQP